MCPRFASVIEPDYAPKRWVVLGPFPNRTLGTAGVSGATREGYDRDFLSSVGGEEGARLTVKSTVLLPGEVLVEAVPIATPPHGVVDFRSAFSGETDACTAYAYGEVLSDRDRILHIHFGSDDSAKVWVNGRLAHGAWNPGGDWPAAGTGGPELRSAFFDVPLRKGRNPILVKVESDWGGWGFHFAAYDEEGERRWRHLRAVRDLPEQEIILADGWPFSAFAAPVFPRMEWRRRALLDPLLSDAPLKVRWFNRDAHELSTPDRDDIYFASVEGATRDGAPMRRILPIARLPLPWIESSWGLDWVRDALNTLPERKPDSFPFADAAWPAARRLLVEMSDTALKRFVSGTQEGTLLLGALAAGSPPPESWEALREETVAATLRVRRKLLGLSGEPLRTPAPAERPAPVLREGSATEAAMQPEVVERMDALCREWEQAEGQPFSLVLARGGVVFMHRAYGEREGRPLSRDATFWLASFGKAFAGLVFAQFVDQGLLDLDDPLGRVFPDFPMDGPRAVTFRQCFTHTSGFAGPGWYGGLRNPTLDNAYSLHLPQIQPGTQFQYGEKSYRLASKALELVSGKPLVRLLREQLFEPLEADSIAQSDPGAADSGTALDVARVGQMLANRGAYGDRRFFAEKTFERLLPMRLAAKYPRMDDKALEWGIGLSWMFDPGGYMRLNPRIREENALGPNVIGHSSLSSSIFRVDLDTGLVVVMGREAVGDMKKHQEYRGKVMKLLKECVVP